jgi:nicotinate-nucleotide adenylyltransferase
MVRLAVRDNPIFEVSLIEVERGGLSYTVDTLRALRALYPDQELYFIVGMDSLAELPTWHDPAGVLQLARVAAVYRAGWDVVDLKALDAFVPAASERVRIIPIPGLDISATDLRRRLASGHPIRYLVPNPVIAYIQKHGLYQD